MPEYIGNQVARATFVKSQVLYIHDSNDQSMFLLIYRDSKVSEVHYMFATVSHSCKINVKNMKGAWEASLMLSILSKHIHQVGVGRFMTFGKPSGALALCTASVSTSH